MYKKLKFGFLLSIIKSTMNTQPCYQRYLHSECKDVTCNFSHEECIQGESCPFKYCGYHSSPAGKIWTHYIKLGKIERLKYKNLPTDFQKFHLEILGFSNVIDDLRYAHNTLEDIESFREYMLKIQAHVNLTSQYLRNHNYAIEFTNPHVPVKYILEKVIRLYNPYNEIVFEKAMKEFFNGLDREINMAWELLAEYTGYQPPADYQEAFPALSSQLPIVV